MGRLERVRARCREIRERRYPRDERPRVIHEQTLLGKVAMESKTANVGGTVHDHFQRVSQSWSGRYAGRLGGMGDLDLRLRREQVHRLWNSILAEKQPRSILEVGCGCGDALAGVSRHGLRVVGTDLVAAMIGQAAALHPEDAHVVADACRLPFADRCMDTAVCVGMLEYVPDPGGVLRVLYRVLRPGGTLIISFPNRFCIFRWLRALEQRLDKIASASKRAIAPHGSSAAAASPYHHRQWSPHAATSLLESVGFRVRDTLFSSYGFWGRLGRLQANLRLSEWMTHAKPHGDFLATWLAATMVILVEKPAQEPVAPAPPRARGREHR